ncbi:MAG: thymidylate synthase [Gammaproteobacteria bacterium]|nr:thymidylate synthase [Gammaproteobacteria bacterium]MCH9744418.1 thymidylate synthase [Gammaproteobacteria bacterium]
MAVTSIRGDSANELVRKTLRQLGEQGETYTSNERSHNANKPILELLNCHLELDNPYHRLAYSDNLPGFFNPGLGVARFIYMISGSDKMNDIAFYTGGVKPYSDDNISVPGSSYGHRIFYPSIGLDQFENAATLIRERRNTKRAAIAVYQPQDCGRTTNDMPCCLNIVFSPRGERLHASVIMRANDAFSVLCYNIFEFTLFFEFFANYTNMTLGTYSHFSVSMHVRGKRIEDIPLIDYERVHSLPMHKMPLVDKTTRKSLIDEEFNIKKAIMSQKESVIFNAAERIVNTYEPYWADMLITLLAQGTFVNFSKDFSYKMICELNLSGRYYLAHHYLRFSMNMHAQAKRAAQAA